MDGQEKLDTGFQCEKLDRRSVVFTEHAKGFVQYRFVDSENTVLVLARTQRGKAPGTSVKLETELLIELRRGFPREQTILAKDWVARSLYRYGGPRIQFESTLCEGTLTIHNEARTTTAVHGSLSLNFVSPRIDVVRLQHALLDIEF